MVLWMRTKSCAAASPRRCVSAVLLSMSVNRIVWNEPSRRARGMASLCISTGAGTARKSWIDAVTHASMSSDQMTSALMSLSCACGIADVSSRAQVAGAIGAEVGESTRTGASILERIGVTSSR